MKLPISSTISYAKVGLQDRSNENKLLAVGITKQSHISKGLMSMDEYIQKLDKLKHELAVHQAYFDAVYCCPHTDKDNCKCKKPLTGMIEAAVSEYPICVKKSYVIGDM